MTIDSLRAVAESTATPPPPGWAVGVAIGLLVVIVTLPLMLLRSRGDRRAQRLLDEWAQRQGLAIESALVYGYARGPFAVRSRATTVYRVTTRPTAGPSRSGWVCINNTFVWGGNPEVRWTDEGEARLTGGTAAASR